MTLIQMTAANKNKLIMITLTNQKHKNKNQKRNQKCSLLIQYNIPKEMFSMARIINNYELMTKTYYLVL